MKTKSLLLVFFAAFFTTASLAQHQQGHSLDWVPVQTIQSPYTIPGGYNTNGFGNSVDIDGDIAVSGDHTLNSVIVYKREGTVWVQKQELTGVPKSDFGEEVIILNNQIIISSPSEPMPNQNFGSVYVYNLNRQTGISSFSQKIQCNSSNYKNFGECLAGENNILIIGSNGDSYNSYTFCGAAYICTLSNGLWSSPVRINHPNPHNGDSFGTKVGVSGNKIAVSAPHNNFGAYSDAGVVYIFTITYKSFKISINPTNIITSPNPSSEAHFGSSMVLKNSSLMIGQPANNYIYYYNANDWKLLQTLYESISGSEFGTGFDFNDQFLVIGSPDFNSQKGKISIYSWQQDEWQKTQNENPECFNLSTTWFGSCIAISDDYFVVGAPRVENLKSNEVSQSSINTTSSYVTLIEFYHKEPGLTADAGEDQTFCSSQAITLGGNPTASLGNPDYSYYWHDNNGWSSTEANPKVAPNQSTTYYLKVTDCNGNGNSVYDTVKITIGCKLPVNISNGNIISNVIDQDGNMYILGNFVQNFYGLFPLIINGVSYAPIMDHTNGGASYINCFITKINSNGCVEWLNKFASSYETKDNNNNISSGDFLSVDENGNTIMVVQFNWNENFISSVGINYDDPYFSNLVWLVKFDQNGSVVWSNLLPDNLGFHDILFTDDALYLLKRQSTNPDVTNFLIKKYSLNGSFQWERTITHDFETPGAYFLEKLNSNELIIAFTQGEITNPDPTLLIGKIINSTNGSLINTTVNSSTDQYEILDIKYSNENKLLVSGYYLNSNYPYHQNSFNLLSYSPQTNQLNYQNNGFIINSSDIYNSVYFNTLNNEIYVPQNFVHFDGTLYDYFYNIAVLNSSDLSVSRIILTPNFTNFTINPTSLKADFYFEDLQLGNTTINQINLFSGEVGCEGQKKENSVSILNTKKPSDSFDNACQINIYPNPAVDRISILISNTNYATYEILSTEGITMMKGEKSNLSETSIDISNFKAGLYIVKFISPTGLITKKFIKQ